MTCALIDRPHIIQSQLNALYKSQIMSNKDDINDSGDVFYPDSVDETVEDKNANLVTVPKELEDGHTSCSETESEYSEYSENYSLDTDLETAKNRLRLVKVYAQLKEEMEKSTTRKIADLLYQHRDKLMSGPAHENIHASKTRSEFAERLLKRVLMGPDNVYEVFVQFLRQEDDSLAVKIDRIVLTDYDFKGLVNFKVKQDENEVNERNRGN